MRKPQSRSAAAGRRPEVRHARQESVGHVIQCLQKAGPNVIHTVRSIAAVMYGDDCILKTRHVSAARRMIDEIEKLKLPLEPCDETGLLIGKAAAKARANSGKTGRWRYDPVANALGEAILEGTGDKPMMTAAIAVLTLESATLANRSGIAEVKAFFDAIRAWIPRSAFQAAARELARRRTGAGTPGFRP
jgi:hypothetical protein